ncbi:hypothetical protein V2G26_018421 [Clonostachys chloroleuca]
MNECLQVLSRLYPNQPVSLLVPLSRKAIIKLLECQVKSSNNDMMKAPASSKSPPSQPHLRYQQPILSQQQPLTDRQYLPAKHQSNQPLPSQQILPEYHTFSVHQSPPSE